MISGVALPEKSKSKIDLSYNALQNNLLLLTGRLVSSMNGQGKEIEAVLKSGPLYKVLNVKAIID